MAIIRLLIVSDVVDNKTKEVLYTSVGFINRPNGQAFEFTLKNHPMKGYTLKVKGYDTHIRHLFEEFKMKGAHVIEFKS